MPDTEGDDGSTGESDSESGGTASGGFVAGSVRGNLSIVGGIFLGGLAYVLAFAGISGLFLATDWQQRDGPASEAAAEMLADESKQEALVEFLRIVGEADVQGGFRPIHVKLLEWIFYNAHGVKLRVGNEGVISPLVLFADSTLAYALIPAVLLFGFGGLVALLKRADGFLGGIISGSSVMLGYLPLVIGGALWATVSAGGGTVAVQLLPAILLAGIAYPLVCGGAAGLLKILVINVVLGGIWSRLGSLR